MSEVGKHHEGASTQWWPFLRPVFVKLLVWFIFGVVVSLAPFAILWVEQLSTPKATLENPIQHGELLLISTAIAAGAVGELIASSSDRIIAKIFAAGGSILVLFVAAAYYGDVVRSFAAGAVVDTKVVTITSVIMFGISVIAGGACIALAEM